MKQKNTSLGPVYPQSKCRPAQVGRAESQKYGDATLTTPGKGVFARRGKETASENGGAKLRMGDDALEAWWVKYCPVEDAIVSAQERRRHRARENRRKRAREFGDICELSDGDAVRWRRDGFFSCRDLLLDFSRDVGYLAYLDFVRRESGRRVSRLKAQVRRPSYYAAENARRRALAAERRKIRTRSTENACPTKDEIFDAWVARRKSHEGAIRFGSLIEDLECYIDNSLLRDEDGVIVGRNPGVKGWLKENIPALALQYTTVMRYKAAAKKLKQITGLVDPTPMDAVLPDATDEEGAQGDYGADDICGSGTRRLKAGVGLPCVVKDVRQSGRNGVHGNGRGEVPSLEIVRARAVWEEVSKSAGRSATALFARLDALTDPERIEDVNMLAAWRDRYVNEITERTKKKWWLNRLWRRVGAVLGDECRVQGVGA